jgi:hypothetical protein
MRRAHPTAAAATTPRKRAHAAWIIGAVLMTLAAGGAATAQAAEPEINGSAMLYAPADARWQPPSVLPASMLVA